MRQSWFLLRVLKAIIPSKWIRNVGKFNLVRYNNFLSIFKEFAFCFKTPSLAHRKTNSCMIIIGQCPLHTTKVRLQSYIRVIRILRRKSSRIDIRHSCETSRLFPKQIYISIHRYKGAKHIKQFNRLSSQLKVHLTTVIIDDAIKTKPKTMCLDSRCHQQIIHRRNHAAWSRMRLVGTCQ